MKIPVAPPDINTSYRVFTYVERMAGEAEGSNGKILFGLGSIKNFGDGIAEAIIAERTRGGAFKSLEDFLNRVHDKNLNKKSLEALIKCGAMDKLGERGEMLGNLEGFLEYNKEQTKMAGGAGAQDSLFSLFAADSGDQNSAHSHLRLDPYPATGSDEKLAWEKELLGLYVSGHPLEKYRETLDARGTTIARTKAELREGMVAVVSGIVEEIKEISTKKGDMMCFLKLADFTSSVEVVMFPRTYKQYKEFLTPDACISIKGKMSKRNDQTSIMADAVKKLERKEVAAPATI